MDQKAEKELVATLHEIRERLALSPAGMIAGPADPAPDWASHGHFGPMQHHLLRGPVADPAPWYLLDKASLARLKIHRLDTAIGDLQREIESLTLERNLLAKEYKLR